MMVFLNGKTDIKRFLRVDIVEILCTVKGNTVKYFSTRIINQFQFHMFQVTSHEFTCAKVYHSLGAEYRLVVSGTERIELVERRDKFRSNVRKIYGGVYVYLRAKLRRKNVCRNIFLNSIYPMLLFPFPIRL